MRSLSHHPARHRHLCFAPDEVPCPRCGEITPRHQRNTRLFWKPDLQGPTVLHLHHGTYICRACPKNSQWFAVLPPDFNTPRRYPLSAQRMLVRLVQVHTLSISAATAVARDLLHLVEFEDTTLIRWIRTAGDAIDWKQHQRRALECFSGQLALDELYDNGLCLLKATDPINDIEIDWLFIEGKPNKADILGFLTGIKAAGFEPELAVTDGSSLYPEALVEIWPEIEHQRCIFHFIQQALKDFKTCFWALYRAMPAPKKRKRGRPKKRGRKRQDKKKRLNRRKVRDARYLVMKREEKLTARESGRLKEALALCSGLADLRCLVLSVYEVFGADVETAAEARCRRDALLSDAKLQALPGLSALWKRLLHAELWVRLTRYLGFENAKKTSNHVERRNRTYRKIQKWSYRYRSWASLCALQDLSATRDGYPAKPVRLRRRPRASSEEEVRQAA